MRPTNVIYFKMQHWNFECDNSLILPVVVRVSIHCYRWFYLFSFWDLFILFFCFLRYIALICRVQGCKRWWPILVYKILHGALQFCVNKIIILHVTNLLQCWHGGVALFHFCSFCSVFAFCYFVGIFLSFCCESFCIVFNSQIQVYWKTCFWLSILSHLCWQSSEIWQLCSEICVLFH